MYLAILLGVVGVFYAGRVVYRVVSARRWVRNHADGVYNPLRKTYFRAGIGNSKTT